MKKRSRNALLIALALCSAGAMAAGCEQATEEKGPDYEFEYNALLRAPSDEFMNIDGKLDEEIWQGQQWLHWTNAYNTDMKASTVFTSKGLYVAMYAEDKGVTWGNRYAFDVNSRFFVQVTKGDAYNYNDFRGYIHPTQCYWFDIDAKNSISRMERRYDAASYVDGELNGETNYISAELFLPWNEMGYSADELNEAGVPESVKLLVQYSATSGYSGFAGFSDDDSYKTYYMYDENGSTCLFDRYSETESVGYSVNGWTPGDRWVVDDENNSVTNTSDRTQMLWFRKDVHGNADSTGSHYVASVKVKAKQVPNMYPHVGLITLKGKTVFNIYGISTFNLGSGRVSVSAVRATDGSQWVAERKFEKDVMNGYTGGNVTGTDITCAADEAYLTVVKRDNELYYFFNGEYVGMEIDERLTGECVIGIFANGQTTVSDWSFEDYSNKQAELDAYLNEYVYFISQEDDGGGYVAIDKTVAKHGESIDIRVTSKPGYILNSLKLNGEEKIEDFLANANNDATWTYNVGANLKVEAEFKKLPSSSLSEVLLEVYDSDNRTTKLPGATYVIRGNDKRFVYTGTVNSKGNIVAKLLKAGTYTIDEKEITVDGNYSVEVQLTGYMPKTENIALPADFTGEYDGDIFIESYPFGSVSLNGATAGAAGDYLYTYEDKNDNIYHANKDFRNTNIQYLKNATFTGDYIFNGSVRLETDSLYPEDDPSNMWKCGAVVGYMLGSGNYNMQMKTAAWISNKLYLNMNGDCEIGLSNFPVENAAGNDGFYKEDATMKFKVARYKDVIYVYNVNDVLCFTLSKDGLELVNSSIVEFSGNLEEFNKRVKAFFAAGNQNAFGLYLTRHIEGGGNFEYAYSYTQEADDLESAFSAVEALLRSGEEYSMTAEGKYMIGEKFLAESNVTLNFANIPENGSSYAVAVQYEDSDPTYFMGSYDKTAGTLSVTFSLRKNAKVWLEEYGLGSIEVNGVATEDSVGPMLTETANGFKVDYDDIGLIRQYYADKKATGDFYLDQTITVVDKTPTGGWDKGSGVGLMLNAGGEKSMAFFTNSWEGSNLIINVGGRVGGTQITIGGFPRDNALCDVGNKLNFKVLRVSNVLYFYNSAEKLVFHVDAEGIHLDSSEAKIGGTAIAQDLVRQRFIEMLSAGDETAFGIYREFNNKAAYEWAADLETDAKKIADTKYLWDNRMTSAASVTLNDKTIEGSASSTYDPLTKKWTYTGSYNELKGFVVSEADKKPVITTGDYVVRVKITSNDQTDFRIYSGDNFVTIRTGTTHTNSLYMTVNGVWAAESFIGYNDSSVFSNPTNRDESNGTVDLTIVRLSNKIYVYGCDYLDTTGKAAKHENWKLLFTFDSTAANSQNGLKIINAWGNDSGTEANGNFAQNAKLFFEEGSQNAFCLTTARGTAGNWIVNVNDNDAAAAEFVANPPQVD